MRILVVTLRYPPYVAGGYELLTRDAAAVLRERGHEVTVLCGRGRDFEDVPHTLPWLEPDLDATEDLFGLSRWGSNADRFRLHFLSPKNLRATQRALRQTDADVVFFFNLGLVSLAPILAARLAGVPTLGYVSDPWPTNHWVREWAAEPVQAQKVARLALLRHVWAGFRDLVGLGELLTCSAYLRGVLVASGISSDSVRVCHLGVPPDMELLAARRDELPERGEGDVLRVACISSFWDGKGQDVLLEAVGRARSAGARIELILAGSGGGEFKQALEARARRADLARAVSFVDALDRQAVSDLLFDAHVLALPSTWGEPFALSPLEGMAHGLAAVLSDAGGSPEALASGVEGVIVPVGDPDALAQALYRLEADEPMRRRLALAGRERARTVLGHAAFVDRLEAALERVAPPALRAARRGH